MIYRSEIDGLRAFAVLPVIFFHAEYSLFSGGYVGVDIFFVISGFLITSIIVNDLEQQTFSFINFYLRRARRILPALFLVMATTIPFAWVWLPAGDMKEFAQSIVSTTLFSSNVLFWLQSGYFDTSAELKPLLHTWSLSVEEQYYFLVPLLLFCVWKFGHKKYLAPVLLCLSIASLLFAVYTVQENPNTAFFHLHTRFWELGIGAIVAIIIRNRKNTTSRALWQCNVLSIIGFCSAILPIFLFDKTTPTPSFYILLPTVGTALIIAYARPNTIVNSILKWPPFVGIGAISYSLYLWHQPVLAFARHRLIGEIGSITPFLFLLILILSYLSWRFVEKPARSAQSSNKVLIPLLVVAASFLGLFGISTHLNGGIRDRNIEYLTEIQTIALGNYNYNNLELREESWSLLDEASNAENTNSLNELRSGVKSFDPIDKKLKMLIVGDSHSKDIFNLFTSVNEINSTYQLGRYGVEISLISDDFFETDIFTDSDVIVLASRYENKDLNSLPELVNRVVSSGKKIFLVHRIFDFPHPEPYNLADRILFKHWKTVENETEIIDLVNNAYSYEYHANKNDQRAFINSRKKLRQLKLIHKDAVTLIDRMRYVCPLSNRCYGMRSDFAKLFYDYGHHTLEGIDFFSNTINENGFSSIVDNID